MASQRLDSKLSISTKVENQFQSPLSSPTSVASSQPSTPLSAPPVNFPKQWPDPYTTWLQPTAYQQYTPEAGDNFINRMEPLVVTLRKRTMCKQIANRCIDIDF